MSIPRRHCIRRDEAADSLKDANIRLEVYKTYARSSCLMECRARNLYDICGCLPYYFPKFSVHWNKTTDCNLTALDCLSEELGICDYEHEDVL